MFSSANLSDSLKHSLNVMALAKTETECAAALNDAALLLQQAAGSVESSKNLQSAMQVLNSAPKTLASPVLSRAVSFQQQEDGSVVSLWLIPVSVQADSALLSVIDLTSAGLHSLRLSAKLNATLGLAADLSSEKGKSSGWVSVVPYLVEAEQLRNLNIAEIIQMPVRVRETIQGLRQDSEFNFGSARKLPADKTHFFFIPFVAHFLPGVQIVEPKLSEDVRYALTRWAQASLAEVADLSFDVLGAPEPFAKAVETGNDLIRFNNFCAMVSGVSDKFGVSPQAMAALVSVYTPNSGSESHVALGITLVCILDGAVLATAALPLDCEAQQLKRLAYAALRSCGMIHVHISESDLVTGTCQHCGELQLALPNWAHTILPSPASLQ